MCQIITIIICSNHRAYNITTLYNNYVYIHYIYIYSYIQRERGEIYTHVCTHVYMYTLMVILSNISIISMFMIVSIINSVYVDNINTVCRPRARHGDGRIRRIRRR